MIKMIKLKSTPLPRWLVLGNSAIIVVISAFFAGSAIGMISVTWDPCSILGGLIILPFPLAVGSLQYLAGFRRNHRAATIVAIFHIAAFSLLGFALLSNIAEWMVKDGSFSFTVCVIVFIISIIYAYCGFCGWMNLRHSKYLRTSAAKMEQSGESGLGRFQFTLRELLAGVLLVALIASGAAFTIRDAGKQYEEHITREEASARIGGLPEGATDVCYCQRPRGMIAYEFTIDEAGFLEWANEKRENLCLNPDSSMKEIQKGVPFTITHYAAFIPDEASASSKGGFVTIPQGYYYTDYESDNGYELGYDTATRRAYFYRYTH
ncbi:MAG: hypothetical protein JXM70_19710 [Pirellulales bacterium]|nr:hypothetical protein [Pirellulales bacterium]